MAVVKVHGIFDTAGGLLSRTATSQRRGYKVCRVRGTNVFVTYTKHNGSWQLSTKRADAE